MREPGRPKLHPLTCEAVDQLMHRADLEYWPQIIAFRIKKYYPLDTPVPPPAPESLLNKLLQYVSVLFKVEADQYEQLRSDVHYQDSLLRLVDRVVAKAVNAIRQLDGGDPDALLLGYHGLTLPKIEQDLKEFLHGIAYQYNLGQTSATVVATTKFDVQQAIKSETPSPQPIAKRLSSQIHSPSAAAKMSAYMNKKGLNQTEFSIQAGTSDKTIRKFIKTGSIKRSILIGIADAMRTNKEDLLS